MAEIDDLFQAAVGLAEPWQVTRTEFDATARRLDLYLDWVWLLCRDCLTWETSGSAVGRGAAAPLGAEREDRFVPNQPPAGTTILPTGIASPAASAALAARNSPLNAR